MKKTIILLALLIGCAGNVLADTTEVSDTASSSEVPAISQEKPSTGNINKNDNFKNDFRSKNNFDNKKQQFGNKNTKFDKYNLNRFDTKANHKEFRGLNSPDIRRGDNFGINSFRHDRSFYGNRAHNGEFYRTGFHNNFNRMNREPEMRRFNSHNPHFNNGYRNSRNNINGFNHRRAYSPHRSVARR